MVFQKRGTLEKSCYFTKVVRLFQGFSVLRGTLMKSHDYSEVPRQNGIFSTLRKHISSTTYAIKSIFSSFCTTFHELSEFGPLQPLHFVWKKFQKSGQEKRVIWRGIPGGVIALYYYFFIYCNYYIINL